MAKKKKSWTLWTFVYFSYPVYYLWCFSSLESWPSFSIMFMENTTVAVVHKPDIRSLHCMHDLWPAKSLTPALPTPARLLTYSIPIASWKWYYGVWIILLVFLHNVILFALSCVGVHRWCGCVCGWHPVHLQLFGTHWPHCLSHTSKRGWPCTNTLNMWPQSPHHP